MSMKRRDFVKAAAVGAVATTVSPARIAHAMPPRAAGRAVVGCQSQRGTSKEVLEYLARHGVFHYDPGEPAVLPDRRWDQDDAYRQVEAASKYGIRIEAYHLPLTSSGIDNQRFPNVMLAKSPERDREIEILQQNIMVAGKAGVPRLLYNTTILPVVRTGRTVDAARGNASYSTWNHEEALRRGMDKEATTAGTVTIDDMFERIKYFLDRLIPVAEEYNVKLGNHIADPPMPTYRGITRWNSPDVFAGIRRFAQLYDSPSHGFNFCIGSIAEGLRVPRDEIIPIIRWTGERKQIFNIHLRNIKGGWGNFQEVYPDNGDMDFIAVIQALKDVGFDGMVMPDHVPSHEDPAARLQAYAYAYGHIKALLQVAYGWDAYHS